MQKCSRFTLLIASLCLSWTCGQSFGATTPTTGKHPEITEQKKLIACSECHQQETPDVYKQWLDSKHGTGMVKCYQCHGKFENFTKEPAVSVCATCHEKMIAKCPKDRKCWACHIPHSFKLENK